MGGPSLQIGKKYIKNWFLATIQIFKPQHWHSNNYVQSLNPEIMNSNLFPGHPGQQIAKISSDSFPT